MSVKPAARRKARSLALQAIYQWQMTGDAIAEIELQFVTEQETKGADLDYFRDLIAGVAAQVKSLDTALAPLVSRPLDDVDQIDKAILRLCCYELSAKQDVPYKVVINEGIELAKAFATDESHKFVNGVLDKLAPKLGRK